MSADAPAARMKRKVYEKELAKLQVQLCHLKEWVKANKLRVIVLFEGRDAAGKGGTIKAITEKVSPRVFRVVALPALEVGMDEQERRFEARINDPLRHWKLSPMDLESHRRWYDYSRARDLMFKATSSKHAPWYVIRSDDKRRARLNCIAHLLKLIPYKRMQKDKVKLPKRSDKGRYNDQAGLRGLTFVAESY